MHPELSRRKRVKRHIDASGIIANLVGILLTMGFFVLSGDLVVETTIEAEASASSSLDFAMAGILLILGAVIGTLFERDLWSWYFDSVAEKNPSPPPEIRRKVLNQPATSALISLSMWTLAGLTTGITVFIGTNNPWSALTIFLSVAGLSGGSAAIIVYFLTERLWRHELPIFFPKGELSAIRAFRVTVRRRIFVMFATGVAPLVLLAVTAYQQGLLIANAEQPTALLPRMLWMEVFLVGVGFLAMIALGLTLGSSLVQQVEELRDKMNRVRKGDLNVQIPVLSNDELGELAEGFNAMVEGLQQEEVIRRLFSLYVTPEVARHAIEHGAELGGQTTEATVLFADIRGFTQMTENLPPAALIALLNRYFQAMSQVVVRHGGLVNKFGGDSLLAVFGSPLNPAADHPRHAAQAAREMLLALSRFNEAQMERGEPSLRIGVGVATGKVVVGNVGSEDRLEYTVIGDTVNVASRLQAMTKELPSSILLSGTTARDLPPWPSLRPMGEVEVRGKEKAVQVYALGVE